MAKTMVRRTAFSHMCGTCVIHMYHKGEIAAPANAKRLQTKTPCALGTGICRDCNSPERICNALVIYFRRLLDTEAEVIIIDEALGL